MIGSKDTLRSNDSTRFTYHDRIFSNEMNNIVRETDNHYSNMLYREAIKTGFYDLQAARDRYRDITAAGDGMNWQLVEKFIEVKNAFSMMGETTFMKWPSLSLSLSLSSHRFRPCYCVLFALTLLSTSGHF